MKKAFIPRLIGGISILLIALIFFLNCKRAGEAESLDNQSLTSEQTAEYRGRESCKECHEKEFNLFQGSDHDMAMDTAITETVLGDFNDVSYTHFGITSRFYRSNGLYMVNTEGPEGKMVDYQVSYVFGVRPLQQYLIEFPGGRYQCLPICWDARPASEGGQRWFHIYQQERIPPDDVLHWTRITQNWNYMCAECHSTNLRKNYSYREKAYQMFRAKHVTDPDQNISTGPKKWRRVAVRISTPIWDWWYD